MCSECENKTKCEDCGTTLGLEPFPDPEDSTLHLILCKQCAAVPSLEQLLRLKEE